MRGVTHSRSIGAVLVAIALVAPAARANTRSQQLYARALIPFHSQRWQEAHLLLDEAVNADPDDALAVYYRGLANARLGFPDKAIKDIEQALSLRPDLQGAGLDLGILYLETGRYQSASEWLQRAYKQPATRFSAAFFIGLTRLRTGDNAAAAPLFAEAAKDPALRSAAQYYQALALLRDGKTRDADALFGQVALGPADVETTQVAKQYLAGGAPAAAAAVAEETPWEAHGDAGFGYDSNVVLAPNSSTLRKDYNTDPTVGAASLNTKGEEDGFFRVALGGTYRLFTGDTGSGVIGYDFYQSVHFQGAGYDLQNHRVHVTLTTVPLNELVQFGVTGAYDFNMLGYRGFYQEGRATPWVTFYEGVVAATQAYYSLSGQDFLNGNDPNNFNPSAFNPDPFDPFRDAINNAFGLRQYFLLGAADRYMSLGYQWDINDPFSRDGTDFAYTDNIFDARVDFGLFDWAHGTVAYLFDLQDYEHPNSRTGFTKRRHDNSNEIVVRLERALTPNLSVDLAYLGVFNGSNIPDFEYDRNIIQARLSLHF